MTLAPPRPLVLTTDQELLDDLLRLAAAAGVEVDVAHAAAQARPQWTRAPLVVVGDDLAESVAATAPPSRTGVLLVTRDRETPDIWRRGVAVGAQSVLVLPDAERHLADELAEAVEPTGSPGVIACVVGGRGGAGASVLSTALAVTAARRRVRTLLVDADPLGGGLDLVLGQENAQGARWPDFADRSGRVSYAALRAALPAFGDLGVLSWDRGDPVSLAPDAMRAVLEAGVRGCDLVIVDLPRHFDAVTTEAVVRADATLLVVPAEVRAVLAAGRVLAALLPHTGEVRLVVREASPRRLRGDDVATALRTALAGCLANEAGLDAALDRGEAPGTDRRGPLARLCDGLLDTMHLGAPA